MRYVATKNAEGEFTGFCSEEQYLARPDLFEGDSAEVFNALNPADYDVQDRGP